MIERALSLEKDIQGKSLLEQLNYTLELHHELSKINPSEVENLNEFLKAQDNVVSVLRGLIAEYKNVMSKKLESRVKDISYCSLGDFQLKSNPKQIEVNISELFAAEIYYNWDYFIQITFVQQVTDSNGYCSKVELPIRWKVVPDWLKELAEYHYGRLRRKVTIENWIDIMLDTAEKLYNHRADVIDFCQSSSNIDEHGDMKKAYKEWKTKGLILSLQKIMPLVHSYHAKKDQQHIYDNSPFLHGSNGTYVENASPYWNLVIKVRRPSYECPEPLKLNIDIHEYVTEVLMPKLGWERMTQERQNMLIGRLKGVKLDIITKDTDKPALYRDFLPLGFKSWGEYLDTIIMS